MIIANSDIHRINEIKNIFDVITSKMSIPLYLIFILTDFLCYPNFFFEFVSIRIVSIGIIYLIRLKSKNIENLRQAQSIGMWLVAANCVPITIMIWRVGDIDTPYYAGLNLIGLGSIIFIPWTKKHLFFMLLLIYGPFLLGVSFFSFNDIQLNKFVINLFFIAGTILISIVIAYFNDIIRRKEFLANKDLRIKVIQIQSQKDEIEDKNKSLIKIGELAAQVAHDIRSPVTALEAVSQMLGADIDPKKKKLIENAAKRINHIANNLVSEYRVNLTKDLSSMDINRAITLNSLIEDIVEEKRLSLDNNHIILLKAPESLSLPPRINSVEFQRVISNLINNAIEAFDKQNGLIDIIISKKEKFIHLVVRDNGKGIESEKIPIIFNKGVSGKSNGMGLGLSHAKQFVESIGGQITIESTLGKETKLEIVFPINERIS